MSTIAENPRELAVLDQASRLLAEAGSLEEIKAVRDKAEAARTFVKAARLGLELQNRAAELKLRAERKAGRLLSKLQLRGGDRKSKRPHAALKLEDLGISRDQSRRWQRLASVSEADFCQYLGEMRDQNREVTSAGLIRICCQRQVKSPARRNSCPARTPHILSSNAAPDDVVQEVLNHCELLADVLRPLYEGGELQFERAERRIVGRLLSEIRELVRSLSHD